MSKNTTTQETGLAAFLTAPEASDPKAALRNIAIGNLREDPENARRSYDKASLEELAASIRGIGLLEPIIVRPDPEAGRPDGEAASYMVVSGHRRLRAAQLIGLTVLPAIVRHDFTDEDVPLAALIENMQREDLTPYEQAQAFNRVLAAGALNKKELCDRAGITGNTLKARLELLEFPAEVGALVGLDGFSLAHAKLILPLADPDLYKGLGAPTAKQTQEQADQALESKSLQTAVKSLGKGKDTVLLADAPAAIAGALQDAGIAANVEKDRKLIAAAPNFLGSVKKLKHADLNGTMVVFDLQGYKDKKLLHKGSIKGKEAGPKEKAKTGKRRNLVAAAAETQMRQALLAANVPTHSIAWNVIQDATARLIGPSEVDFAVAFAGVTEEKAITAFKALFAKVEGKAIGDAPYKVPTKWWNNLEEDQAVRLAFGLHLANQVHLGWPVEGFMRHITGKSVTEWTAQAEAEVQDAPEPVEQIAP